MNFKDLEAFLDRITNWRIPGADCAVYYKNRPVFRYTSGYSDVETKTPISEDNLYFIYSVSKVLTCAAALQLYEKGLYLLNDPLSEYIPEYKEMYIVHKEEEKEELVKAKNSIRIRDLFTMSAGFTYNLRSPGITEAKEKTSGRCPTLEIVKAMAKDPLIFEPGARWNYSLCHDVLGGLIEVISGMKFSEYMRKNIFEPLGMKDTGYYLTEEKKKRMASLYRFNAEILKAEKIKLSNSYQIGTEYESGGAGLISSVNDYIKFANAMCRGGLTSDGEHILSPGTIELMRTNQLDENQLKDFCWAQTKGYGYGLGVRTMTDRAKGGSTGAYGEFGWGGAAGAYVMIDPDNEIAVYYAQHMLNNQEPFVHPRIRNIVYSSLLK